MHRPHEHPIRILQVKFVKYKLAPHCSGYSNFPPCQFLHRRSV
jgi:hypothetical protein